MEPKSLVLVADDNPDILTLLMTRLTKRGYEVITARNGKEALEQAWAMRPDVIVLDWMMPLLPGSEVCAELKDSPHTENIPIIMLTSRSAEHDVTTGFAYGADEYITKPFDFDEVVVTIERLIAQRLPTTTPPPFRAAVDRDAGPTKRRPRPR